MRNYLLPLLLALTLMLPRTGFAQVSTTEDRRLATKITLMESDIRLGEFVERISEKSGVSLSIDNDNEWSGIRLFVQLRGLPLESLLRSLQSFFSHEGVSSRWIRGGKTEFHYQLAISPRYNRTKRDRQYWADKNFQLLKSIGNYSHLSEEEKAQFKESAKKDKGLYNALQDSRMQDVVQLMQSLFDPPAIQRILRGEFAPRIPLKDLEGANRVRGERLFHFNVDSLPESLRTNPAEGWLLFETSTPRSSDLATSLFVLSPMKGGAPVGSNYIGRFIEEQARKEIGDFWIVRGDESAITSLSSQDPGALLSLLQPGNVKGSALLSQLSETLGVSVIAILPGDDQFQSRLDRSKPPTSLTGIFENVERFDPALLLKRHAGVLLACPAPWFTDNKVGRGIPLSRIRAMNAAESANPENSIPLLDLPDLIASLDSDQVEILGRDFTVLHVAGKMTPFFLWLRRHPEDWKHLKEGQGVPLNSSLLHALTDTARLLPPPLTGDLLPNGVSLTNLTLYFTDTETPLPPGIELPETLPKDYLRARIATLSIKKKSGEVVKTLGSFYFTINPRYRFTH